MNPYEAPSSGQTHPTPKPAGYATAPVATAGMPPGVPYIVANEAAERFSYYGMRAILITFMTKYMIDSAGKPDLMTANQAQEVFHSFMGWAYLFPVLGALVSDGFLGKYRTILLLSMVYCLGHLALALDETRFGLYLGLGLIALGAGGIKPCVSAHVGDQFGKANEHLLEKVFGWFYFSINLGAFASSLLTPWLLSLHGVKVQLLGRTYTIHGPAVAFGVPGVLMALATLFFWLGRNRFVHIPAGGLGFIREAFSGEGLKAVGKLALIYSFLAVFWSLYDQTGSAWVVQAERLDRRLWGGWEVLPAQVQSLNPLLILLFIPLFSYVVYPAMNRVVRLTALRKILLGFALAALAFGVSAGIEHALEAGVKPHVAWQGLAYVVITASEVMVSITALEFSYTQAPKQMKSFIMAMYFFSVSAGNFFTSAVNALIQNPDGSSRLSGAMYYWFFSGLMAVAALAFVVVVVFYREQRILQDQAPA